MWTSKRILNKNLYSTPPSLLLHWSFPFQQDMGKFEQKERERISTFSFPTTGSQSSTSIKSLGSPLYGRFSSLSSTESQFDSSKQPHEYEKSFYFEESQGEALFNKLKTYSFPGDIWWIYEVSGEEWYSLSKKELANEVFLELTPMLELESYPSMKFGLQDLLNEIAWLFLW